VQGAQLHSRGQPSINWRLGGSSASRSAAPARLLRGGIGIIFFSQIKAKRREFTREQGAKECIHGFALERYAVGVPQKIVRTTFAHKSLS
jgi:hypothetical protein